MLPPSIALPNRTQGESSKLRTSRDPSIRIRQAVRDNNVPLLTRLQNKTDLRNVDKNRLTSLSWAAIEGSLEVFEWLLLDYGHDDQELSRDTDNNTILHLLAAIPSSPSISPHTHLHHATPHFPARPSTKPLSVQIDTSLRMTELYLALFPFVLDWSNSGGKTALHIAAQSGNTHFINLLCDFGAEFDSTDLQGNTPLHYASAWGHADTIRCLLERGCSFSARNFEGFTASDFAFSSSVLAGLEGVARGLYEERRNRRKMEGSGKGRMGSDRSVQQIASVEGRSRSESVGTNVSYGSGGGSAISSNVATSSGGRSRPSPIMLPPRPDPVVYPNFPNQSYSNPPSKPNSRRPSQSQVPQLYRIDTQSPPPLPMQTPPLNIRHHATTRAPSIPVPGAGTSDSMSRIGMGPLVLGAPVPVIGPGAVLGSVGMRRAGSAQTESSIGAGSRSGARGPMI